MAPTQLSLPDQLASQAEFIVNNLRQTDYQHPEKVDVDRGIYDWRVAHPNILNSNQPQPLGCPILRALCEGWECKLLTLADKGTIKYLQHGGHT
jgi:hypothetical protein